MTLMAPLRRIVEEIIPASDAFGRRHVLLECGHRVACSGAAIYRARCRHCRREVERLRAELGGKA